MHVLVADAGLLSINGTLIAEIIAFLVMLAILARWVYPPVIRAAQQREQVIETGLRQAEEAQRRLVTVREEVEQLLEEARVQAREIIARAHREATAEAEEVRNRARRDAEAFAERARNDIIAERDRALRDVRAHVGALVVAAASKLLGEAIDAQAHKQLIDRSLESLEKLPR